MSNQLAAGASPAARPLSLQTASGGRPRLLLAEDSDPVRIVTAAMLKSMGCDVEAVVHGEQAVQQAGEQRFDVIVLDIEMPIMDGITAARSIRRMGGYATGTPIMALSAFLADSMRSGQWHDTFDIALPKPANKNELHDAVKAALAWQHKEPERASTETLPPVVSRRELEAIHNGIDAGVWRHLTKVACRDINASADQIERLSGAVQDDAVIAFAAKLRALGRTFAAPRLALLAQRTLIATPGQDRHRAAARLVAIARETSKLLQS